MTGTSGSECRFFPPTKGGWIRRGSNIELDVLILQVRSPLFVPFLFPGEILSKKDYEKKVLISKLSNTTTLSTDEFFLILRVNRPLLRGPLQRDSKKSQKAFLWGVSVDVQSDCVPFGRNEWYRFRSRKLIFVTYTVIYTTRGRSGFFNIKLLYLCLLRQRLHISLVTDDSVFGRPRV